MNFGRKEIYTDVEKITSDNIIAVLRQAYIDFKPNASDCEELIKFEAGNQPLVREKKYRSDIDIQCVDNVANEITEFKCGFDWGNVITLIQRGQKDTGKIENESEAIALLNEEYAMAKIGLKQQQLARFVEICGIGFTYVDINTSWEEGDAHFTLDVLDPRNTFVVKSSRYIDHRPMLGVTFRQDSLGNTYFTCFSDDERWEVINLVKVINSKDEVVEKNEWNETSRSGEKNPLGIIPIQEWVRAIDRMGCFERQIPEINNLNILISDTSNQVDQTVQAIWHCNDVDFPEDENGNIIHPKSNDWLQTYTSKDGNKPFVTPLSVAYDHTGILNNIVTRRSLILQKANVPQRNDNSGGSTGVAMSDATGWSSAENSASKSQGIKEACKLDEVKLVLRAISLCPDLDSNSPLLKLKAADIQPNIKRQKTYEMTTKANTFATLVSHGVDALHVLKVINLFDDPNQVYVDSKESLEKYQKSVFEKTTNGEDTEKRTMQDESDQVGNSPLIDGMSTENKDKDNGNT